MLDFPNLRQRHQGTFFKSLEVRTPGKTTGLEVVPGDKLKVVLPGATFNPVVEVSPNLSFDFQLFFLNQSDSSLSSFEKLCPRRCLSIEPLRRTTAVNDSASASHRRFFLS